MLCSIKMKTYNYIAPGKTCYLAWNASQDKKTQQNKSKRWDLASFLKILYSHVNTLKVILWYPTNNQVSREADSHTPAITEFNFYWTEFQTLELWQWTLYTVYNTIFHYGKRRIDLRVPANYKCASTGQTG